MGTCQLYPHLGSVHLEKQLPDRSNIISVPIYFARNPFVWLNFMRSVFGPDFIYSTLIVLLLVTGPSHSADPDPLQDFCIADLQSSSSLNGFPCKPASNVTSDDFFFNGLSKEGNTSNSLGSFLSPGNVLAFPGVNTLGVAMNRIDIAPGGVFPPHLHPRASEIGVLVQGKLLVGLITTGNVVYTKNLTVGQVFVVPRGLVHFQMNIGLEKVLIFSGFNSHFPGSVYVAKNLFTSVPTVPDQVLIKAFQVSQTTIDEIKSNLSK